MPFWNGRYGWWKDHSTISSDNGLVQSKKSGSTGLWKVIHTGRSYRNRPIPFPCSLCLFYGDNQMNDWFPESLSLCYQSDHICWIMVWTLRHRLLLFLLWAIDTADTYSSSWLSEYRKARDNIRFLCHRKYIHKRMWCHYDRRCWRSLHLTSDHLNGSHGYSDRQRNHIRKNQVWHLLWHSRFPVATGCCL